MSNPRKVLLEVCIASVEDAVVACAGGADRLELNLGLELDGLTPTIGMLEEIKHAVSIPVFAMVRPRPGGFRYNQTEHRLMIRDAELLLAAGADGIVSGAILENGKLDEEFWLPLRKLSEGRPLVFHRAIDVVPNQLTLLQQLIDSGTARVLTSGGCTTAWEGRYQIAKMQELAANQIEIIAGSGVSPDNAVSIIRSTGCSQLHGSFSEPTSDSSDSLDSRDLQVTRKHLVASTRAAIDSQLPTDS